MKCIPGRVEQSQAPASQLTLPTGFNHWPCRIQFEISGFAVRETSRCSDVVMSRENLVGPSRFGPLHLWAKGVEPVCFCLEHNFRVVLVLYRKRAITPSSGTPLLHRASDTTLGLTRRLALSCNECTGLSCVVAEESKSHKNKDCVESSVHRHGDRDVI
jgi:hypothetical protein